MTTKHDNKAAEHSARRRGRQSSSGSRNGTQNDASGCQWPRRDSNPHEPYGSADFKSAQKSMSADKTKPYDVTLGNDSFTDSSLLQCVLHDDELQAVVRTWHNLSEAIKGGILSMIKASIETTGWAVKHRFAIDS